jgi:hypothetical protein
MKTAATIRGAAWIAATILGLVAVYLVAQAAAAQAPPSQAEVDQTVWSTDEALCAASGFPVATQENLSCVIGLRGGRNYPVEMGSFP